MDNNQLLMMLLLGSGAAGGLSNRAGTTSGNSNTISTYGGTSTRTPNLTAQQQALIDQITGRYTDFLDQSQGSFLQGYQANATSDINKNAGLQQESLDNINAARGITGPAAGTGAAGIDAQRFSDITKLNNNIPLLDRQLKSQAISMGPSIFGMIPTGETTDVAGFNNSNTQSTQKTSGNVLGGTLTGLTKVLAMLYGGRAWGHDPQDPQNLEDFLDNSSAGPNWRNQINNIDLETFLANNRGPL